MYRGISDYPVRFEVDYPEVPSRGLAFLGILLFIKPLLLIPHLIVLSLLSIAVALVVYVGYWVVLITGSYPWGLFDFVAGIQRWQSRTDSWLYGFADNYPPFSWGLEYYPANFEVDYPETPSRIMALLGALLFLKVLLVVPHLIILSFLSIAMLVAVYIGHWAVLITGRYPVGLLTFVSGVQRWEYRTGAWVAGLVDRYPPFSFS